MDSRTKTAKALLLKLISASSESGVKRIIDEDPILSKDQNWKPYGGYTGNFNTIHNQQQDSVAALAEKPINAIDHLLLKECKLRHINPEGEASPKSMQEAVEQFFGIRKGDFSEVGVQKRREIASNILLIAEGSRERPDIIVADTGEGQHPSDFENTFVSLHKGNKDKVRFVQGKYNMGGTGVLRFCGDYHYQLILSRKTPELLQPNQDDRWGLTLVRLHVVTSSQPYEHSWYEYCVDENGGILSFPGEALNILPDDRSLPSGTYIKLFDYYLDDPSIIGFGLWRELNRRLHAPVLPIMLYEARDYKGHSRTKLMLGNKMRTLVDERDSIEHFLTIPAKLGKFGWKNIEVTLFKEGTNKSEFTTQNDAIFLTINGQTHATIGRSFLRTKAKLYYLADYLLVHIDCTDVETNVREQTFMPNRERMPRDEISKEVEEILANELRNHEGLQKLNQFRREQLVIKNPKDTEFLEGVVSNLIKNNRTLINYLGLGGGVKDAKEPGEIKIEKYEGKRFPTYLKILSYSSKDKFYRKQIPVNSYARLKLQTDAANDYFDRLYENGEVKIDPDVMSSFYLWNGIITIKLVPPRDAKVGGVQRITVEVTRPYEGSLFVEFEVEYTPPITPQVKPPYPKDAEKGKAYKLPEPILVYKEKGDGCISWFNEHLNWTGEDIAKVAPSGGVNGDEKSLDVFINMDANVLHDYLRRQPLIGERQQDFIKKSWETSTFLNSLVLYNDLSKLDREDMIPDIMKSISKITLDLMHSESLLKELERD